MGTCIHKIYNKRIFVQTFVLRWGTLKNINVLCWILYQTKDNIFFPEEIPIFVQKKRVFKKTGSSDGGDVRRKKQINKNNGQTFSLRDN